MLLWLKPGIIEKSFLNYILEGHEQLFKLKGICLSRDELGTFSTIPIEPIQDSCAHIIPGEIRNGQ